MNAWAKLIEELDQWVAAGQRATMWWRDDDAMQTGEALECLLSLGDGAVPLTLAVIPKQAEAELAERIGSTLHVTAVQHGWRHRNHSPQGERSVEFGSGRSIDVMVDELGQGKARLQTLFGTRFIPVFVPPWNRITLELAPFFPGLGMAGLSTFGPRNPAFDWPITVVNTHVDLILWRDGRRFIGENNTLAGLVAHLAARRQRLVDKDEPTGLLTHHLVHEEDIWRFLSQLFAVTLRHPGARWLRTAEVFVSGSSVVVP
ncbi:MAG: polysaccharide deacetylase family protein [Nitrosomonadales bacterium]|nr:polysaccharide deacetylase family protein [Nitrosomonadales bacterium]